ncbi:hypothetical protein K1719_012505 [Acacia pycnantha]|nr:hypothetical protein K1719_012505 [Acacia pycnantha]
MEKLRVIELLLHFVCLLILVYVGSCNGHLITTCLASDRETLMDFKAGLEDHGKVLSSWRGSNCCEWHGIECDNNTGAVVALDLRSPYSDPNSDSSYGRYVLWNLSGEIRSSLMKLKSLTHLDLSFNTFNGVPRPEFLGSLENFQYLILSRASFTGTIPPRTFRKLISLASS